MATESENQLANVITEWLRSEDWEVFEEVSPWGGNGRRADLVGRKNSIIWVIETKRSFNLEALEQSEGWAAYAHFRSIAIWQGKRLTAITERVCRKFGTGLITVRDRGEQAWGISERRYSVSERVESFFNRRANCSAIKQMLLDETRATGRAGNSAQKFETPFKATCRRLFRVVAENPGIELEEALRAGGHHYQDNRKAKINILNRMQQGEIPDIEFSVVGKRILLFSANDDQAVSLRPAQPQSARQNFSEQINLF